MNDIMSSMWAATRTQFNPKMMMLIFAPFFIALILWSILMFVFWGSWHDSLMLWVNGATYPTWISPAVVAIVSGYFISIMLLFLLAPAVYLTTILITAFFSMPIIVQHVQRRYFPQVSEQGSHHVLGSILNTLIAIGVLLIGWILGFPFWLLTPLAPVMSLVLTAYMIQRLFRYDALAAYATDEEMKVIIQRSSSKFFMLGIIAAFIQFIPIINLFMATWVGLSFTFLAFNELRQLREYEIGYP